MKTKIISVLLCVCMLAGVMSFMSFALTETGDSHYDTQVTLKDPLEIERNMTDSQIYDKITDYLVSSYSGVKPSDLKGYFNFSVLVNRTTNILRVTITEIAAENVNANGGELITITNATSNVLILEGTINWFSSLYEFQMGVRKYGEDGANLVSAGIAKVTATYEMNGKTVTSVTDTLYDFQYGDEITITTELNPGYDKYYEFYCWVDGSGKAQLNGEKTIIVTMHNDCALFAVYKEIVDRYVVTYEASEGGKIVYADGNNLKIFEGDGQVSALEGSSPKFTFVPDEGYEVSKVIVNEDGTAKEVSSIKTLFSDLFDADTFDDALTIFGTYADATNKDVYTYTIKEIAADATIEVTFIKSTVYEPASGVEYVPGPELSTGTSEEADADDSGANATTLPAEGGEASIFDVANPQTGSTTAIAVFATLSLAAAAAFVTAKKKRS